jgi:hypothetical protein
LKGVIVTPEGYDKLEQIERLRDVVRLPQNAQRRIEIKDA